MATYEFEGKSPEIGKDFFVHPEATLIGEVIIGENCFIGPGVRLRADWCRIEIADNSNIQDNCIIHAPPNCDVSLEIGELWDIATEFYMGLSKRYHDTLKEI